jgi:hypothetical protein
MTASTAIDALTLKALPSQVQPARLAHVNEERGRISYITHPSVFAENGQGWQLEDS